MRFARASERRLPPAPEAGSSGLSYRDCRHEIQDHDRGSLSRPLGMTGEVGADADAAETRYSVSKADQRRTCHPIRPWPRRHSRLFRRHTAADLLSFSLGTRLLLVLGLLSRPCLAAFVHFENCLPEPYLNNDPTPLQWVPLSVDASFGSTDPHTLRVTMWGNVTGSSTNVSLPAPNSPDWSDNTKKDGKILDEPEPDAPNPKLTTLHTKVEFLTYEPHSNNTNFCNTSLANATCPLAPVFNYNSRWVISD